MSSNREPSSQGVWAIAKFGLPHIGRLPDSPRMRLLPRTPCHADRKSLKPSRKLHVRPRAIPCAHTVGPNSTTLKNSESLWPKLQRKPPSCHAALPLKRAMQPPNPPNHFHFSD